MYIGCVDAPLTRQWLRSLYSPSIALHDPQKLLLNPPSKTNHFFHSQTYENKNYQSRKNFVFIVTLEMFFVFTAWYTGWKRLFQKSDLVLNFLVNFRTLQQVAVLKFFPTKLLRLWEIFSSSLNSISGERGFSGKAI